MDVKRNQGPYHTTLLKAFIRDIRINGFCYVRDYMTIKEIQEINPDIMFTKDKENDVYIVYHGKWGSDNRG